MTFWSRIYRATCPNSTTISTSMDREHSVCIMPSMWRNFASSGLQQPQPIIEHSKVSRTHGVFISPTNARSALWPTNTRCHFSAHTLAQSTLYADSFTHTSCSSVITFSGCRPTISTCRDHRHYMSSIISDAIAGWASRSVQISSKGYSAL